MNEELASLRHPKFRGKIARLALLGLATATLAYLTNVAISSFGSAVAAPGTLPWIHLAAFVGCALLQAGVTYVYNVSVRLLVLDSLEHLETAVLQGLMKKPPEFFVQHSQAEILSRLAIDAKRAARIRPELVDAGWSSLVVIGNLAYFVILDVRLAAALLVVCTIGVMLARKLLRPIAARDHDNLRAEEKIAARLREAVSATDEVRVGGLERTVVDRLANAHVVRRVALGRYFRLDVGMTSTIDVFRFLALASLLLIVATRGGSETLRAVPVVLWSVPSIYGGVQELVPLFARLRLAETSVGRIAEYLEPATTPVVPQTPSPLADAVRLENVTYSFRDNEGRENCGIANVSVTFERGTWTAIAGPSGSGKSTLIRTLLGLVRPDAGTITIDQRELSALTPAERASAFAYMPQVPILIDGSILDNLAIGVPWRPLKSAEDLTFRDLDLLESTGLASLCKTRALGLPPSQKLYSTSIMISLTDARARIANALREQLGLEVVPAFSADANDELLVVEQLTRRRGNHAELIRQVLDPGSERALLALPDELRRWLVELARATVAEVRALYLVASYDVYARLAPRPVDASLWALRKSVEAQTSSELDALRVGLTFAVGDIPGDRTRIATEVVRELDPILGQISADPDVRSLNPYLSWRDNLLFGQVRIGSHRVRARVDDVVMRQLRSMRLDQLLVEQGLASHVGADGQALSGGQRQMVTACRAFMRGSPVIVLDEPTAALDPIRRDELAKLFDIQKRDRAMIIITHDQELMRRADRVVLLDAGRVVDTGRPDELLARSELFRKTIGEM